MRKHVLPIVVLSMAFLQFARGAVISIFGDDFESGTMANWTATSTTPSPLDPFTPTNAAPPLGQWSAFMNVSTDRMHRNIIGDNGGTEATGHLMFSAWIYDQGVNSGTTGATRVYNELRGYSGGTGLPNGGTTAGGALAQLLAAGKFNSVTLPGEVFTSTKYQGRVAFHSPQPTGDTGWFNLNAPGSPNRSVGWHRFDIEVMPDGTTFKFYVDGILSRTFTGGTASTYDSLILGPGLGSQQGNAWIDGISVGIVDELPTISCPSNKTVYTTSSSGAVVNYPAPVANDDGGAPFVECNPPSGSTFPVGTTTVACTATDSRDQQARCSFQVTVRPVLIFRFSNSLARITLQLADGQTEEVSLTGGSDVELDLGEDGSAGDLDGDGLDDAAQRMTALTLDGTSQSLGAVRLRLRESPSRGLTEETSNGQAGILDLPPHGEGTANSFFDVFVEILAGNQVFHTATPMHMAASLSSVPPARGDRYTETASHDILDANGNFTGIRLLRGIYIPMPEMVDIICPPNMVVWGEGPTAVTYIPLAQTDCGPPLTITCNPPSGSSFPVGTTFVQCTATDACGNTDECHFFVKVKSRRLQYVNFGSDGLPSPQGMYVSSFDVRYGNGVMLRNVNHRNPDPSYPPPALGDTVTHEFDAQVSFDFSTDGGATYSPATVPARMVVRITHTHDEDGTQFFDTEMLAMDITGGSLPPGAMLRESPTRASLGKTQIRRGGGGYQIGSFFDVFTELSLDGGMNWSEAEEGSYMDLAFDPTKIPPVAGPSPNLPPRNDVYVTRPHLAQMYGDGIMIRNVRHRYFSQSLPPPPPGESRLYEFDALVDFQLSLDGGNQWQPIRANGRTAVVLQHSGRLLDAADQPATHLYASEVLQLDISGGDLPPGVRLRESPTRASTGGTALRQAQAPQGTHHIIHSFFDIFTELTLDGGMTWQQPTDPARVELQCYAPETEQPNDLLPPPQGEYGLTGLDPVVSYGSGAQMLKDLVHESFSQSLPPPPFGQNQLHQFRSQVSFQHSGDGGQTWLPYQAIGDFVVQVVNIGTNHIDHFDTEILQMNISGGTLPAGILIRESPTKQSLGRTSIQSPRDPASGFAISSFFDIWTELTVNGGQTWMPADGGAANVSLHLDRTEGTLMCADGMPLTNCPVTIQFYNQNGLAASTTGTTDINGYFNVLLNASGPHFNSYFVITTPCCGHTWTIPSSSPWGNLGQLTCDRCGEAPCVAPPTNMVAWWTFDEPPGPIAHDLMGFNNQGGRQNGPAVIAGKVKNALCFNGVDQYVHVLNHPEVNFFGSCPNNAGESFTIDMWIKPDSVQGLTTILDKRDNPLAPRGYSMFIDNGRLGFQMADGIGGPLCGGGGACNNYIQTAASITAGAWHHVAVTVRRCDVSGNIGRLYVDGVNVFSFVPRQGDLSNLADLLIGMRHPSLGYNFFRGCIDEVEIFKRALTFEEIEAIYNAGSGGKCKPCNLLIQCPQEEVRAWTCNRSATVCFNVTATSNCGEVTVTCTPPSCSAFAVGNTSVNCEASDSSGSKTNCTFNVTVVQDTAAPVISCPTNRIERWVCPETAGAIVTWAVSATDDCDQNVTITCVPPSGYQFPPGLHTVTCTARDDCGQIDQCRFEVNVTADTNAPVVTCPGDIREWTCETNGMPVNYVISVSDDCDLGPTVICSPPSGGFFPIGTTTVTCVARDRCGNQSLCEFRVTVVQDVEPPSLACPTDFRFDDCQEHEVNWIIGVIDDCDPRPGVVCTPPAGSVFPIGTTTVTCVATDQCGNSTTCSFKVEINCRCVPPPAGMVDWWTFDEASGPIANDIMGFNNLGVYMNGPTVIAGKVKNALCFNGDNQWVEVRDHPEINFLGDCSNDVGESFTIDAWIRLDSNGLQGVRTFLDKRNNPASPQGYSFYVVNGRLGFQMANGVGNNICNSPGSACNNYVEPNPSITPGVWHFVAVTVQRCRGMGTLYVDGNPVLTFTPLSGDLNNPADMYIGVRNPAFGGANFPGCIDELEIFKRALSQTELQSIYNAGSGGKCKPCIRCPNDITVTTCDQGTNVCYDVAVSPDCEGITVRCEPPPCSFFPANSSTLVKCEAIDATGVVVEQCEFAVTVIGDTRPPTITCPADITVPNDPGACGAKVDYIMPQAGDNCPGVTVTCTPPSGSFFPFAATLVTCTATDGSGNTATCTFSVIVRDVEPPVVVCPPDIRREACRETVIDYSVTVSDNCPNPTVTCVPPSGSPFPVGTTTVTCTATDSSGNSASCTFKVELRCPCAPPPAGMVDWWTFDEAAGPTAADLR